VRDQLNCPNQFPVVGSIIVSTYNGGYIHPFGFQCTVENCSYWTRFTKMRMSQQLKPEVADYITRNTSN